MSNYFLVFGIVLAVLLNIIACYRVLKTDYFDKHQKIFQIILIWLIPFIASVGIVLFLFNENNPSQEPTDFGGGTNDSIGGVADD
ncbi:hypothetical protein [Kangiella spongicola]|uniref:Uncharacterized protein n=1 Tax=Kangiella spongicola TaxID=796379 RepID=A0A318D1U7_9GAMM|nr:hypothetical protein [Kangiella spongicola]PXF63212.1 hypothetical protein DL796_07135 [Kangiella spongicola]